MILGGAPRTRPVLTTRQHVEALAFAHPDALIVFTPDEAFIDVGGVTYRAALTPVGTGVA